MLGLASAVVHRTGDDRDVAVVAQHFAGATLIPLDFETGSINASAYAAKQSNGTHLIAIINKDAKRAVSLRLPGTPLSIETTTAASLTATQVKITQVKPRASRNQIVPASSMSLFTLQA